MSGPHYMRAAKIARLLDISERTVRRWIATEMLPSVKIGGARLVAKADLERLLSANWNPDEEDE
jgi:excisionase family DNA binding protein